jgi:hypothetical protein
MFKVGDTVRLKETWEQHQDRWDQKVGDVGVVCERTAELEDGGYVDVLNVYWLRTRTEEPYHYDWLEKLDV